MHQAWRVLLLGGSVVCFGTMIAFVYMLVAYTDEERDQSYAVGGFVNGTCDNLPRPRDPSCFYAGIDSGNTTLAFVYGSLVTLFFTSRLLWALAAKGTCECSGECSGESSGENDCLVLTNWWACAVLWAYSGVSALVAWGTSCRGDEYGDRCIPATVLQWPAFLTCLLLFGSTAVALLAYLLSSCCDSRILEICQGVQRMLATQALGRHPLSHVR
jgi:hypothetical protein